MIIHILMMSTGTICSLKNEGGLDTSNLYYNQRQIFPYRFRSSRIFWSTNLPLERTLYVFEILSDTDIVDSGYIVDTACPHITSEMKPIFKVTIMNDGFDEVTNNVSNAVIFASSVEEAYAKIVAKVEQCHSSVLPEFKKRLVKSTFGLNAYQFFGLGYPFVRRAIEMLPFSIAAVMAPPTQQYLPCFVAYSSSDLAKFQQQQFAGDVVSTNASGCARAEGFEQVMVDGKRVRKVARVTKLLAKAIDDGDDTTVASDLIDEEQNDENRRVIERNRLRYHEMASEYKLNPFGKLQVRRSRIHGWGLFARTKFYKNDMIVEYIGQKIRAALADLREVQYEEEGVGSCYLFRLDRDAIVDATRTGGMARFINHCCEPNAYARVIATGNGVPIEDDRDKHIVIFALKDIEVRYKLRNIPSAYPCVGG